MREKINQQKQVYGLRKLSVGVGSVLLGTMLYCGTNTVHADVADSDSGINTSAVADQIETAGSATNSQAQTVNGSEKTSGMPVQNSTPANSDTGVANEGNNVNSTVNTPTESTSANTSTDNTPVETQTMNLNQEPTNSTQANYGGITNSPVYAAYANSFVQVPATPQFNKDQWNISIDDSDASGQTAIVSAKTDGNYSGTLVLPNAIDIKNLGGNFSKVTNAQLDGNTGFADDAVANVTNVVVSNTGNGKLLAPVNMEHLFTGFQNAETMDLSHLDTSNVTNMDAVFANLDKLKELNLSGWDVQNVTKAAAMFSAAENLKKIQGLENFNFASAMDLSNLLQGTALETFDGFTTGDQLTNVSGMLGMMQHLTSADVSKLNLTNVNDMGSMFMSDNQLTSVKGFNQNTTQNVVNFSNMFSGTGLTTVDMNDFGGQKAQNLSGMFMSMPNLTTIANLQAFGNRNKTNGVNQVTDLSNFVSSDSKLTSLNLSGFDNTQNLTSLASAFSGTGITDLDLSGLKTNNVTDMSSMLMNDAALSRLNLGNNFDMTNVEHASNMFDGAYSLNSLDLGNLKMDGKLVDAARMFAGMTSTGEIKGLDKLNTSSVISMAGMFDGDKNLTNLDPVSNFQTGLVDNFSRMFADNEKVDHLDLSKWDTHSVKDLSSMFDGMRSIKSLNLSNFTTNDVTNFDSLFNNMNKLDHLDLSNWDFSNFGNNAGVTDMNLFGNIHTATTNVAPEELQINLAGTKLNGAAMNALVHPRGDVKEVMFAGENAETLKPQLVGVLNDDGTKKGPKVLHTITFVNNNGSDDHPANIEMPIVYKDESDLNNKVNDAVQKALGDKYAIVESGTDRGTTAPEKINGHYVVSQKVSREVQFVDDDFKDGMKDSTGNPLNKTVRSFFVNGTDGSTVDVSTGDYGKQMTLPANYVLAAGQVLPSSVDVSLKNNSPLVIHLRHKTEPYTGSGADETKTITRKIQINVPGQDARTEVQQVKLVFSAIKDLVTGEKNSPTWSTEELPEFKAPEIKGFKANKDSIAAKRVTYNDPVEIDEEIDYSPVVNKVKVNISFIDITNSKHSKPVSGQVLNIEADKGQDVLKNVQDYLRYKMPNYQLNESVKNVVVNPSEADPSNWNMIIPVVDKIENSQEKQVVKRNVVVISPADQKQYTVANQEVTLVRNVHKNLVTAQVAKDNWTPQSLGAVDVIAQLKKQGVNASTWDFHGLDKIDPQLIDGSNLVNAKKNDDGSIQLDDLTISPSINQVQKTIQFVDADNNNQKIGSGFTIEQPVGTKMSGADVMKQLIVPAGYSSDGIKGDVIFDQNSTIQVPLHHKHQDITGNADQQDKVKEVVSRTIYFKGADTKEDVSSPRVQKVTFTRTATRDLVTGEVTYGTWNLDEDNTTNHKTASLDGFNVPEINGYTSKVSTIVTVNVDPNNLPKDNLDQTVTYDPILKSTVIKIVDDDEHKDLFTDKIDNLRIGLRHNLDLSKLNLNNYNVVGDQQIPDAVTIDKDTPAVVEYHVTHKHELNSQDQTFNYQITMLDGNQELANTPVKVMVKTDKDLVTGKVVTTETPDKINLAGLGRQLKEKDGYKLAILSVDPAKKLDDSGIKELANQLAQQSDLSNDQALSAIQSIYTANTPEQLGAVLAQQNTDILGKGADVNVTDWLGHKGAKLQVFYQAEPISLEFKLVDDDDPKNPYVAKGFGFDKIENVSYAGHLVDPVSAIKNSDFQKKLDAWLKANPNYELVTKDVSAIVSPQVSNGKNIMVPIHVRHKMKSDVRNITAHESIELVNGHGEALNNGVEKDIPLLFTTVTDLVTGKSVNNNNIPYNFNAFEIPQYPDQQSQVIVEKGKIDGLTADSKVIPEIKPSEDNHDFEIKVIYKSTKVEKDFTYKFVDDDDNGKAIAKEVKTVGYVGEMAPVTDVLNTIAQLQGQGYMTAGDHDGDSFMVTKEMADNTPIVIHLIHQHKINTENHNGTLTVKSVDKNGKEIVGDQILKTNYKTTITTDVVTKKEIKRENVGDSKTTVLEGLTLPGYQTAIAKYDGKNADIKAAVDSKEVTQLPAMELADGDNGTIILTYQKVSPKTITRNVVYVFNGQKVGSQTVSGPENSSQEITLKAPDGYDLPKGQDSKLNVSLDTSDDLKVNVVKHQVEVKNVINTVQFIAGDKVVSTQRINGKLGQVVPLQVPENYHLVNPKENAIQLGKDQSVVKVPVVINEGQMTIQFVDEKGNTVGSQAVKGSLGQALDVSLQIPKGYKLADKQQDKLNIKVQDKGIIKINVVADVPVKPDDQQPVKVTDTQTATRRIIINDPITGSKTEKIQTVNVVRTGLKDPKTGKTVWNAWQKAEIPAFEIPSFDGFTSNVENIGKVSVDKPGALPDVNITYTKNVINVHGTITYIDDHGSHVGTQTVTGHQGDKVHVSLNVPTGYHLVDGKLHAGIDFDLRRDGVNMDVIVVADHEVTPEKPVEVTETKVVSRIINVQNPLTGKTESHKQDAKITRTGVKTKDQTKWGNWSTAKLDGFDAPVFNGYTAKVNHVDELTINQPQDKPMVVTIEYTKNSEKPVEVTETKVVSRIINVQNPLTGKTESHKQEAKITRTGVKTKDQTKWGNWSTAKLDGFDAPVFNGYTAKVNHVDELTINQPQDKPVVVTIEYTKNSEKPVEVTETETVSRIINVLNPENGKTESHHQNVTITRTGQKANDKSVWSNWSEAELPAFDAPEFKGYTAKIKHVNALKVSQPSDKPIVVTIEYTKNNDGSQTPAVVNYHGTINYVTANGQNVGHEEFTGQKDTKKTVNFAVPEGYYVVNGSKYAEVLMNHDDVVVNVTVAPDEKDNKDTKPENPTPIDMPDINDTTPDIDNKTKHDDNKVEPMNPAAPGVVDVKTPDKTDKTPDVKVTASTQDPNVVSRMDAVIGSTPIVGQDKNFDQGKSTVKAQVNNVENSSQTLPQTGNQNSMALIALGLSTMSLALVLLKKKAY